MPSSSPASRLAQRAQPRAHAAVVDAGPPSAAAARPRARIDGARVSSTCSADQRCPPPPGGPSAAPPLERRRRSPPPPPPRRARRSRSACTPVDRGQQLDAARSTRRATRRSQERGGRSCARRALHEAAFFSAGSTGCARTRRSSGLSARDGGQLARSSLAQAVVALLRRDVEQGAGIAPRGHRRPPFTVGASAPRARQRAQRLMGRAVFSCFSPVSVGPGGAGPTVRGKTGSRSRAAGQGAGRSATPSPALATIRGRAPGGRVRPTLGPRQVGQEGVADSAGTRRRRPPEVWGSKSERAQGVVRPPPGPRPGARTAGGWP